MGITQIKAAKRAFETTDLPEKLGKYHWDAENAFYGWNQSWLHPDFRSWDVQDVIEKITTPILAIQGMDDQYGTLQQIESIKAHARVAVNVEILHDCKHSPHLEHSSKVLDAIKTFSTAFR
jgi:pimeloyl-ACP methyl ester carboxylesterase